MNTRPPVQTGQTGLTLVELLVVIVIISVVAAMAMMQRGSANEQFQRQNVARELKVAFERARFDSVKRRADGTTEIPFAEVIVDSNQFTLRTDSDLNAAGLEDFVTTVPTNISIARFEGGSGTVTLRFNKRGEVTLVGANEPVFIVCNGVCSSADDTTSNADIVLVTATGTVNLLAGGSTPQPSFTPPAVAPPVGAGSDVNPRAVVTP